MAFTMAIMLLSQAFVARKLRKTLKDESREEAAALELAADAFGAWHPHSVPEEVWASPAYLRGASPPPPPPPLPYTPFLPPQRPAPRPRVGTGPSWRASSRGWSRCRCGRANA